MDTDLNEAVELFKALADPTRLRLLDLLSRRPRPGFCVTGLAHHLGVSQPAVSQHLRVLRQLGLVHGERSGYRIHYVLDAERLHRARELISQVLTMSEGELKAELRSRTPEGVRGTPPGL